MMSFKQFLQEKYTVMFKGEGDPEYTSLVVTNQQFKNAYRFFQVDDERIQNAIDIITKGGVSNTNAQQIISIVMKYDNPDRFFNAIENKSSLNDLLADGNILRFMANKYGFSPELTAAMISYQPNTHPVTGKGETFLTLFIEGAKKGATGDIDVNGQQFEVKGAGARIRGQKGFGAGTTAAKVFSTGLKKLLNKAGIKANVDDPKDYNIAVKSNGIIDTYVDSLLGSGKVTRQDIVKLYVDGFRTVYEQASSQDIAKWVSEGLDQNARMIPLFKQNYFAFAVKYYATVEHFDSILMMYTNQEENKAKYANIAVVSRQDIFGLNSTDLLTKIQPASWPSFTAGAGPQGAVFAIKPA